MHHDNSILLKAILNKAKMLVQLLDVTYWLHLNTMLDVGILYADLRLHLLKIFVQHDATLLGQQCHMRLGSFKKAII